MSKAKDQIKNTMYHDRGNIEYEGEETTLFFYEKKLVNDYTKEYSEKEDKECVVCSSPLTGHKLYRDCCSFSCATEFYS